MADHATPNLPARDFAATAAFYAKLGFVALNNTDVPLFLKDILEEEKRHGLADRTAMRLLV